MTGNYTKNGILDTLKTELLVSKHLITNKLTPVQSSSHRDSSSYMVGEMKDAFKDALCFKTEEKGITCRTRLGFLSIQEVCCWKESGHGKHCTSKKGDYAAQHP